MTTERSLLLGLIQRLNEPSSAEALYQAAVDGITEVLRGDAASLWLVDADLDLVYPQAWRGHPDGAMRGLLLSKDTSLIGRTMMAGGPIIVANAHDDPAFQSLGPELDRVLSTAGAPLLTQDGRVLGALFVDSFSTVGAFSSSDIEVLGSIAELLSMVLQRAQLLEERKRMALRLQAAHEMERGRIARYLHDEVGGQLTFLHLRLNAAGNDGLDAGETAELGQSARVLLESIRSISSELRPPILDDVGLVPALESMVGLFQAEFPMDVQLNCHHAVDDVPDPLASVIFRVTQEGLVNAARYSNSSKVEIRLSRTSQRLVLDIEDDGVGFSPEPETYSGLLYMHDRVHAAGGTLWVDSSPGSGTRLHAEFAASDEGH